jgi:hypothetical protein
MQTEQESNTPASSQYTFGSQSAAWLEGLTQRKRRPVAPSSLATYQSRLRTLDADRSYGHLVARHP